MEAMNFENTGSETIPLRQARQATSTTNPLSAAKHPDSVGSDEAVIIELPKGALPRRKKSDGQYLSETQVVHAVADEDSAQVRAANHSTLSPLFVEIQERWRMRQRWHRAEKALILQAKAFCRSWTGGDKEAANKLFDEAASGAESVDIALAMALAPFLSAIEDFADKRKDVEKQLRKLSRSSPVWPWVSTVKGFGDLNLAAIIGEAGDISLYRSPSCLWKRMGLAVINGGRQRRVTGDAALEHGYNPQRRCVAYLLGETLVKAGEGCVYRPLYNERKAYELERVETKAHAHNRAARYIVKRALRDLWRAWRDAEMKGD